MLSLSALRVFQQSFRFCIKKKKGRPTQFYSILVQDRKLFRKRSSIKRLFFEQTKAVSHTENNFKVPVGSPSQSVVIWNVNGLNSLIKRHNLAEWIKRKTVSNYMLSTIYCFKSKDMQSFKVKGWKKILHAKSDWKGAGVATLIPSKIDFRSKTVRKDKGQFIMIEVNLSRISKNI